MHRSGGLTVYVPFKYDLGGSIIDTRRLLEVMEARHGAATPDAAVLRTWNLSYLAGHAPVLSCALEDGEVDLGGAWWTYRRRLRVYPWLGVVSVDYLLTVESGRADLARFYDDLVEWKNRDYLPYLGDCGAVSESLSLRIPGVPAAAEDLHGSLVRALRDAVSGIIEPRPFCYAFHDFRLCFVGGAEDLPDDLVQQLMWLSADAAAVPVDEPAEALRFRSVEIVSSGWSTVVRREAAGLGTDVDEVVMLLGLIHAQWYVCQLWINAYSLHGGDRASGWLLADAHVLSANQSALAHDLSEIDNLNVMLKDPGLLRVARYLEGRIEVRRHRETAMSRLRALENHSRQLADFNNERELRRFQTLFAISAAAGVAGLVPAIGQVGFTPAYIAATFVPLIGLWGLFAIDLVALRRRWRVRRHRSSPD